MFRRFDVVHAHHSSFLACVAIFAARLVGKEVVVTLHGLGALDSSVGRCPIRTFYRFVSLKGAARIIATSEEMVEVARRFAPDDKIVLITNGVATDRFSPSGERSFSNVGQVLRLATLRRMNPKNGVHFVVNALGQGKDRLRFFLRMAGDGPLRGKIEKSVNDYSINDSVKFEGFLSHQQVIPLLEETDVAMFMSTAESTSLAALECMSMGCIVVCSNAGAFPQFVKNGETGFIIDLFPAGKSDYIAPEQLEPWQTRKIIETLEMIQRASPEELKKISDQSRSYVESYFDWSVIAQQTVSLAYPAF